MGTAIAMTALARAARPPPDDDRAVLVTADDLGLCHASTVGVLRALRTRVRSPRRGSSSPRPGRATPRHAPPDGTSASTWRSPPPLPSYRRGPVDASPPSLLGGDGGFPATVADLHDHADPDEVRRECRAQLERAVPHGVDADAPVGPRRCAVQRRARAVRRPRRCWPRSQRLPLRLPDRRTRRRGSASRSHDLAGRARASSRPDVVRDAARSHARTLVVCRGLGGVARRGVTELVVRPAVDTDELRALAPDAAERVADLDGLLSFGTLSAALLAAGVRTSLGWSGPPRRREGPASSPPPREPRRARRRARGAPRRPRQGHQPCARRRAPGRSTCRILGRSSSRRPPGDDERSRRWA